MGRAGGLILLWDTERVQVLEILEGSFTLSIKCKMNGSELFWTLTNVYGPTETADKNDFWEEMSSIGGYWQLPWLVCGDFNAVKSREDRTSGSTSRLDRKSFQSFIDDFELKEFDRDGHLFTYCNNQSPPSYSYLDRFLTSNDWCDMFGGFTESAMNFFGSDHRMVLLKGHTKCLGPKPFRFQLHWLNCHELFVAMESWWAECTMTGTSGFVLDTKLHYLKQKIKDWTLEHLDKLETRVNKWEQVVKDFETKEEQGTILQGYDLSNKWKARAQLHQAIEDDEFQCTLKSNQNWQAKGDRCSKFFHQIVNHRISLNMEKPFTEVEILAALKLMEEEKTPGTDGFPIGVYRRCWHFMRLDVLQVFRDFYSNGYLDWRPNTTRISLIPKINGIKEISDFRPISLIHSVYKLIAKVLACRLNFATDSITSPFQGAGVEKRNIHDIILVANELIDSQDRSKSEGYILKVDFWKAFDSISWGFIDEV